MASRVCAEADLDLSVDVGGERMTGSLRGSGADLELSLDRPDLLGGSGTAMAREAAARLASTGLRLAVVADGRHLVTLGAVAPSFWQRRVSGSRYIRVTSLGSALRLVRLRRVSARRATLVPPPTPLPMLPTFLRRPRVPTTTHDPARGGYPRLVLLRRGDETVRRQVFRLGALTTVGSAEDAVLRLDGTAPLAATIRQTEDDEFMLGRVARDVRVNGVPVLTEALLRTGSRVEVGPWTLVFAREEYADHGRPYGGRIGGELGRQLPQPPRNDLQGSR